MSELRRAFRTLRRRPSVTALAVLTLALAIGANTAMFSVVYGVLLRPLPFPESERLAAVWLTYPHWQEREGLREFWDEIPLAYPEYERLRDGTTTFEGVSIYRTDPMTLTGGERLPEMLTVGSADDALPVVLGIAPEQGRWFTPEEAAPGGERVAVLTHDRWVTSWGGDPSALGRTLHLNGDPYVIVGILPEGVRITQPNQPSMPHVWIPLGSLDMPLDAGNHAFDAVARIRPDVQTVAAEAESARLLRGELSPDERGARVVPLLEQEVSGVRTSLFVLWGAVGLILLLACVNVANLLLARSIEREWELGVRHALGAGRWRIARQLMVESALLALLGGTAGIVVSWLGMGTIVAALPPDLPRLHEIGIVPGVLVFALSATALTTLFFGVGPSVLAGRRAAAPLLREGVSGPARGSRLQGGLVALQMGLALVLLVSAGLFVRTLGALWNVDPGFDRQGILTFEVALPPDRYQTPETGDAFFRRLSADLGGMESVSAVGTTSILPLSGGAASNSVWPASYGPEEGAKPEVQRRVVTPGLFEVLGVPLVNGRVFTEADDRSSLPVMLVSHTAARRLWEGRDPIGDRVEMNARSWTVVGIVDDVQDQSLRASSSEATVYVPAAQWDQSTRSVVLRTHVPPATLAQGVRRVVEEIDPALPVTELRSMDEVAGAALAPERFRAGLLGGMAVLAGLLAGIGLYGVVSHVTARRTRELGIRMALGARRREVLGLVLRRALLTAGVGIAAGTAVAVPATRTLEAFLFQVPRLDPVTYVVSMTLLVATALAGALLPAWRASRLDPTQVLRHE